MADVADEKVASPVSLEARKSSDEIRAVNDSSEDLDEQLNPRKWSRWRKRMVFITLMSSSILADG